ncbi:MAG: sulfatase-like hydrolase/transferase [Halioglobus sp.]
MSQTQVSSARIGPLKAFCHLAGALAIALVQPGYDLLGRYPEFFVARKVENQEVFIAVAVLSVLLPLMVWAIAMVTRLLSPRVYRVFMALTIGVLVGAVAIQVLNSVAEIEPLGGVQTLLIAGAVALATAVLYLRAPAVSAFFSLLSLAAVIVPVFFLFFSPINKVLFGVEEHVLGPEVQSSTPVIFVVFDELPTPSIMSADRTIDALSFPAFAALAADATWYRNATTVAAGSLNAIPAILTGRYPVHTYIPNAVDYPESVFALLGRTYGIAAFEPITALCTQYLCSAPPPVGLRQGLMSLASDLRVIYSHLLFPTQYTTLLPAIDENWMGFEQKPVEFQPVSIDKAEKTEAEIVHAIKDQSRDRVISAIRKDYGTAFEDSLKEITPGRQSFLYFQHVQLPHVPWRYLPSGKQYRDTFVNGKEARDQWVNEQPWLMAQGFQRHLLQVKYVDTLLGKLINALRDAGIYDEAMIVITADHGASFKMGAHRRTTTANNMPEIAGVPLLIKYPRQKKGAISDKFVETVDIVPTIADVLEVKSPWTMDGFSLLDELAPTDRVINVRSIYGASMYLEQSDLKNREWLLDFKQQWFGAETGNGIANLFAMGPGREFLGRSAASLSVVPLEGVSASLVRPQQYEKVYLSSPYAPARVIGKLNVTQEQIGNNDTVVITVNGRVEGAGQVFTEGGEGGQFSVMVPAAPFKQGANTVGVYWVNSNAAGEPVFHEIALTMPAES